MIQDYQNKKGRLTKRDYKADFKLADSDDFFGFNIKEIQKSYWKQILIAIVVSGLLYGMLYILLALTPNI
jgi:hypothetical protein